MSIITTCYRTCLSSEKPIAHIHYLLVPGSLDSNFSTSVLYMMQWKKNCTLIEQVAQVTCAKLRLCTSAPLILMMASPGCRDGHWRRSHTRLISANCPPCPPAVTLKPMPPPSLLPRATGTSSPPVPAPGDPRLPGAGRGGLLAGQPLKPQGGSSVGGTSGRWALGTPGGAGALPTSGCGRGRAPLDRSLSEHLEFWWARDGAGRVLLL